MSGVVSSHNEPKVNHVSGRIGDSILPCHLNVRPKSLSRVSTAVNVLSTQRQLGYLQDGFMMKPKMQKLEKSIMSLNMFLTGPNHLGLNHVEPEFTIMEISSTKESPWRAALTVNPIVYRTAATYKNSKTTTRISASRRR